MPRLLPYPSFEAAVKELQNNGYIVNSKYRTYCRVASASASTSASASASATQQIFTESVADLSESAKQALKQLRTVYHYYYSYYRSYNNNSTACLNSAAVLDKTYVDSVEILATHGHSVCMVNRHIQFKHGVICFDDLNTAEMGAVTYLTSTYGYATSPDIFYEEEEIEEIEEDNEDNED